MRTDSKKLTILYGISIFGFLLDRLSKYIVAKNMVLGESIEVLKGFFGITYVINEGIVFGLFHGVDLVFLSVAIFGVAFLIHFLWSIHRSIDQCSIIKIISYGFIISGGLGNSYDRFVLGYVVDFIDFFGIWRFVFNIADALIHVGLALFVLDRYFFNKEGVKKI